MIAFLSVVIIVSGLCCVYHQVHCRHFSNIWYWSDLQCLLTLIQEWRERVSHKRYVSSKQVHTFNYAVVQWEQTCSVNSYYCFFFKSTICRNSMFSMSYFVFFLMWFKIRTRYEVCARNHDRPEIRVIGSIRPVVRAIGRAADGRTTIPGRPERCWRRETVQGAVQTRPAVPVALTAAPTAVRVRTVA